LAIFLDVTNELENKISHIIFMMQKMMKYQLLAQFFVTVLEKSSEKQEIYKILNQKLTFCHPVYIKKCGGYLVFYFICYIKKYFQISPFLKFSWIDKSFQMLHFLQMYHDNNRRTIVWFLPISWLKKPLGSKIFSQIFGFKKCL